MAWSFNTLLLPQYLKDKFDKLVLNEYIVSSLIVFTLIG